MELGQVHASENGTVKNSYVASWQVSTVLWKQEKLQTLIEILSGF